MTSFRLPGAAAILVASLIVGVCVVAGVPKASSDPVSISADELLSRIERAHGIAELGEQAPSRAGMESVRSTLGLPVSVRLGNDVVPMAADPFLDTLDGSRADDFSRAIAHLDALERLGRGHDARVGRRHGARHRGAALAGRDRRVPGDHAPCGERSEEHVVEGDDGERDVAAG